MADKRSSVRPGRDGKQAVAVIVAAILLISLVPVLITGFYAHPSYDDYIYGISVHHVVEKGGGPIDVIKAAAATASTYYEIWQGTFSACFIFSLQPGVFSDDIYFLTPFILIGTLVLCTFGLFHAMITKLMKGGIWDVILLSAIALFMQIQFVPDKSEAFYWFNGASYYTLFYSLAELFFALLIRLLCCDGKKHIRLALLLLALIIGGGNYTTALFTAILLTFIVLFCVKNKRKETGCVVAVWCALCVAFVISMIAPGNRARASGLVGQSASMAVLNSLYQGAKSAVGWLPFKGVPFILLTLPVVYSLAAGSHYSFRYPIIAIGFAFGLFCAQMTPPLYAMSNTGAGRQVNIYYYAYFLLLLFCMYYVLGWYCHRRAAALKQGANHSALQMRFILIGVVLAMACLSVKITTSTSYVTAKSLADGSTQRYDRSMEQILNALEAPSDICVVDDVQDVPEFFNGIGLDSDSADWMVSPLAQYFHHEEVRTH